MQLRLIDVDEGREPIFDAEDTVAFSDPLDVVEYIFQESNVIFPQAREYRLQLFAAGEPLLDRPPQGKRARKPDEKA